MHHLILFSLLLSVSLYGSLPSGLPAQKSNLADASTGEVDEDCCDDNNDVGEVDEDIIIDEEESNDDEGVNN